MHNIFEREAWTLRAVRTERADKHHLRELREDHIGYSISCLKCRHADVSTLDTGRDQLTT